MNRLSTDHSISNFPKSYWLTHPVPLFPKLTEDSSTEVAVIGGGITGILTAYLLAKAGRQVTLVEAQNLVSGVTGNTTAKITAQHSLIYHQLVKIHGEEKARLYYEANLDGLNLIQRICKELNIECDLETKSAVVYSTTAKGLLQLRKEASAYGKLQIEGTFSKDPIEDLPFETTASLTMPNQAQFHPVKFLAPIVEEIQRLGGEIYEQTRAVKVQNNTAVLMENETQLEFKQLVVATHYPFNDFNGFYFSKLSIDRSYIIAAKTAGKIPKAMYINAESPSRSLRSVTASDGQEMLLIGGESHSTGKSKTPTQEHYQNLKEFGQRYFNLRAVSYHWSSQDLTTLDKLPYIGQMTPSSSNIFMATGFQKWGMAMGAIAGKIIKDSIIGQESRYTQLFDPNRGKLKVADIKQFVKKNAAVGKDFVVSKTQPSDISLDDLGTDEGGLIEIDGKKIGSYRDQDGQVHLVKTRCTHMGCGLNWNNAERSWDCPCHGSRFSFSGEVLDGPAVEPLEKVSLSSLTDEAVEKKVDSTHMENYEYQ